jgi:hypothetical protein
MKVYLVEESYRSWDDGWDTIIAAYFSIQKAEGHVKHLNEHEENKYIEYNVIEMEVTE